MIRKIRTPDISEIAQDDPLLLEIAAKLAFKDGSISGLALRNAIARKELSFERLGGRLYTTLAAIKEWRALCREKAKVQGYGGSQETLAPMESRSPGPGPSKMTVESGSALESARHVAAELRRTLKQSSRRNAGPHLPRSG